MVFWPTSSRVEERTTNERDLHELSRNLVSWCGKRSAIRYLVSFAFIREFCPARSKPCSRCLDLIYAVMLVDRVLITTY